MKKIIICFLFLSSIKTFSQRSDKPLFEINHQPFLVITASPLEIFDIHNNFMMGAEIAPPFGKFSLNLDYGIGGRGMNIHPFVRQNFSEMKTQVRRLELRTYQSDWYNFTQLDKKPLGRYFALEVGNKKIKGTRTGLNQVKSQKYVDEGYYRIGDADISQNELLINFKYGKHLLIRRFVVLDVYGGPGLRIYDTKNIDPNLRTKYYTGHLGWADWLPQKRGVLPNFAFGIRYCLPL